MSTWKRALAVAALCGGLGAIPAAAWAGGRHGHGHGGHGHHHGGGTKVVIGVGSGFWWGGPWYWGPRYAYYGYPYPYPYPYPYSYPPVVVNPVPVEQPVYVERGSVPAPAQSSYWYYCDSAGAYYPDVETCPEPWVRVPPRAE